MGYLVKRPLSEADKQLLAAKLKPSQDDIQHATDDLFMNLLTRLAEVEDKLQQEEQK